jgi:hypothetical protein
MSNKVLDNLSLSQFLSTNVDPIAIPKIWVCAAPETPTAHKSLLILVIAGATAVGGGDLIVVVDSEEVVLLDVESVTIGSAANASDIFMTKSADIAVFLIIFTTFLFL